MEVLRTPDECFAELPGFDFEPHYLTVDDTEGGQLRVHYLDEGPREAAETVLMLHGQPSSCFLYRTMISRVTAAWPRTCPALAARTSRHGARTTPISGTWTGCSRCWISSNWPTSP